MNRKDAEYEGRLTIWDIPGEIAVPLGTFGVCDEICENAKGECEKCIINKCFTKLAKIEDVFPFSVGDVVYTVDYDIITKIIINGFEVTSDGTSYIKGKSDDGYDRMFNLLNMGKVVFKTYEEAETHKC